MSAALPGWRTRPREFLGEPLRLLVMGLLATAPAACATAPPPVPAPVVDQQIVLETETGAIHGSLNLPGAYVPAPVALIIAGSGPTDRNGNMAGGPGENNSYRMLAEGLAQRGIASLRYDKRGIGASAAAAPGGGGRGAGAEESEFGAGDHRGDEPRPEQGIGNRE